MEAIIKILMMNQANNDGKIVLDKEAADRIIEFLVQMTAIRHVEKELLKKEISKGNTENA